jgi:HKD family nuclease
MLNTHSNADRLDYRALLSPPPDYTTAFAVGTTYSLDLETLTAVCDIIGLNIEAAHDADTEPAEYQLKRNLHKSLGAISMASRKLLLFSQGGQITKPDKYNKLLPLLENSVCEVNLENRKSFHPKVWFLRYSDPNKKKDDKFRLVVLSRNLTFDRSWDVAVTLDSADAKDVEKNNVIASDSGTGAAMRDFLMWLTKKVDGHNGTLAGKAQELSKLADDIATVSWKSPGREFDRFGFIPYGIGSAATDNLGGTFQKMLVISPFLSEGVIKNFAEKRAAKADCTLITRASELHKLNKELFSVFKTWTMKDKVVNGEQGISESGGGMLREQDIHAKVYLRTEESENELYTGSANASRSAFHGNVECLLKLCGDKRRLNADALKRDLFGPDENARSNPFERVLHNEYTYDEGDAEKVRKKLETAIREFAAAGKSAAVGGDGPDAFTVTVTIEPFPTDGVTFTLSPLMAKNSEGKPFGGQAIFERLKLPELSEWYVVTASSDGQTLSKVVKIATTGIPEGRDGAVFREIIRDKEDFLTYIAFLLSGDYPSAASSFPEDGENINERPVNRPRPNFANATIIYEPMLKAAAISRERLDTVKMAILSGGNTVPEGFDELFQQFEKAVNK